jgi:hypothetical protein
MGFYNIKVFLSFIYFLDLPFLENAF